MCFLGLEEEVGAGLLGHYCVASSDCVGNYSHNSKLKFNYYIINNYNVQSCFHFS